MPINALSDANKHLIEILVTVKIIAVWNDYTYIKVINEEY